MGRILAQSNLCCCCSQIRLSDDSIIYMTITKSVQTSTRSYHYYCLFMRLLWWLSCKESTCNAGNLGSIPGSERSHGGGPGNSLQQFCLENPIDWGAWWAAVHQGSQSAGHDWVTGHTHVPLCDSQVVASCVQQERPGRMGVGVGHLLELKGPIDLRFSSSQWELGHAGLEQNIHIIIAARQL